MITMNYFLWMISVINMTVLTIVFIAQLVERLDNFLLFLKDENWYKIKKKKENILKRVSKEPTRLAWDLLQPKVSSGTFPLWIPPELVVRAGTTPSAEILPVLDGPLGLREALP